MFIWKGKGNVVFVNSTTKQAQTQKAGQKKLQAQIKRAILFLVRKTATLYQRKVGVDDAETQRKNTSQAKPEGEFRRRADSAEGVRIFFSVTAPGFANLGLSSSGLFNFSSVQSQRLCL